MNTFGNYDYDALCYLTDYPFTRQSKPRMADFVTGDGSFTAGGGIGAASQRIAGFIGGQKLGTNNIIDVWRTFVASHNPGSPAALYLDYYEGTSFRYAEVESISEIIPAPPLVGARQFELNFSYADPFFYRTPKRGPFPLIPGANTFSVQGTVYSAPFLTLTVSSPGTGIGTAIISHDHGTFLLKAGTPGVYTIDSRQGWVKFLGQYFFLYDGVFPLMLGGVSSTLQIQQTGGLTLGSSSVEWYDRD